MAEVLGFEHDEALTLGQAVAGLNAYSEGVSLGLFQPTPREVKEQRRKMEKEETVTVDLLHRAVPAKHTDEGLRALSGESPIHPAGNWRPYRDLIQRQMIHAMRIVVLPFEKVTGKPLLIANGKACAVSFVPTSPLPRMWAVTALRILPRRS